MITRKKTALIIMLLLPAIGTVCSQQSNATAGKLYETWISVNHEAFEYRGILYKINDSSVVIGDSKLRDDYQAGKVMLTEIPAGEIDYVKMRLMNIVKTGAIIGSVIGLAAAVGLGIGLELSGAGGLGILVSFAVVPGAMAAGALIGMLVTSPNRHKTLINRNIDDFLLYRDKLKQYSYLDRYNNAGELAAYNPFKEFSRNKAYFNMTTGIAVPFGSFPSEYLGKPQRGNTHSGSNISLNAGYMLSSRFSISLSNVDYEYVFGDENISIDWGTGGFLVNAGYCFPSGERSILNIKSGAGPVWSFIDDDEETDKEGSGAGMNAAVTYGFVLSGRWCLTAEAGYFLSFQKFEGSDYVLHAVTAGIGIEYRFIKK